MKILRLRLAGFGPYKKEEVVDFERFDGDGIFLISGKTGAGKSSILDAICFALYNQVPRFDGSEHKLRSDHCEPGDPTFVELDFSINEVQYRVRRSPAYERLKKNGTGVTTALPTAVLHRRDGDDWRGIAAKLVTVGRELDAILPLKADQFLQVILLAQNRFQRFLLAKTEERRMVLRTLFNTSRFDQLEKALIDRRKGLDEQVALSHRNLNESQAAAALLLGQESAPARPTEATLPTLPTLPTLEWFTTAQHDLVTQRGEAARRVALHDTELSASNGRYDSLVQTHERQVRRAGAETELGALELQQVKIARERADLHGAEGAARVLPQLLIHREATLARDCAEATLATARAERQRMLTTAATFYSTEISTESGAESGAESSTESGAGAGILTPVIPESLDQILVERDRLIGRLGALDDALADEGILPSLNAEIIGLFDVQMERSSAVIVAQEQLEALPAQIDTLRSEHSATLLIAARRDETTLALDRAVLTLEAAKTVDELSASLLTAEQNELSASGDNAAAAANYEAVLARRFGGFSAELAARLVTGTACSVCGSTAHPRPARGEQKPVTPHDLEAARTAVTERQGMLATAHGVVQSVALRLAEARAVAHGGDLSVHVAEWEAATIAHAVAGQAATHLPRLASELANLRADLTRKTAHVELVREDRDRAVLKHAARISHRVSIVDRLAAQRGAFDSVQLQVTHLQAHLTIVRALAEALQLVDQRRADYDDTHLRLRAQLAQQGFLTAEAVQAARLDPAEIERRTRVLRLHDDALAAARATLAHPDLADLPHDIVDIEPARLAVLAASAARDIVLTLHSSLIDRSRALDVIVGRVTTLLAASGALHSAYQQVRELAEVVHGDEPNTKRMRLENYVLAAQLEEIVAAANTRLRTMTSGRYALEHDDSLAFGGARSGLGLAIRDEYTGRARATQSLSGGETFLASLALALGLAEVVTGQAGGIALDTLFVDEGFGSLDGDTLETAMSTLDTLRAGGRTIGLISHVESMKEQIPATVRIVVTDSGYSRIEAGGPPAQLGSGEPRL